MRNTFLWMLFFFSVTPAPAHSAPVPKAAPQEVRQNAMEDVLQDDVPLAFYLDTLSRISPAAREGAEAYLQAFQRRCGRPLKAIELRRAIANGRGDPVLMAMMRAAPEHDAATLQHLSDTVSCTRGK